MNNLTKITTAIIALFVASCVHEYPKQQTDPTHVNTHISLTTAPNFAHSSILSNRNQEIFGSMYFVVELHDSEFGSSPVIRREIGVQKDDNGAASIQFDEMLAPGKYKCVAYAVAANDTEGNGIIFNLDDLSNIGLGDMYSGNTDAKESYETRFDLDVSPDGWFEELSVEKAMSSPMGSVEVISTDVETFIKNEISRLSRVSKSPEADLASSRWAWNDYYVVWRFDLYYPVRYNAYTGLPNKAETMVSFRSTITPRSDDEVSLGMDYIFVNGDKSQITLTLELYDKQDNLLNVYSGINVLIERGKTTIIRGEYLTDSHKPGVGIDPGFEGEINIVLPDN